MSEIGDDIKDTYQEVGTAFTILRDSENITGEYCDQKLNSQVTKPFTRQFFRDVALVYDTVAIPGDVIRFDETGEVFLLTNKTPRTFENEILQFNCVFYQCNVSGVLSRLVVPDWDGEYRQVPTFQVMKSGVYGLLTEALYGHELDTEQEFAQFGLQEHELYVPHSLGAQIGDRFEAVSGEYYQVETKKTRRYQDIDVLTLAEDTR